MNKQWNFWQPRAKLTWFWFVQWASGHAPVAICVTDDFGDLVPVRPGALGVSTTGHGEH